MARDLDMAYAVHTRACTYLLDEAGVCRWIVSQQGVVPPHVRQCIGAQFVASLDVSAPGGLVGELRAGTMALLVRYLPEEQRMVLLRTGPISHIDDRRGGTQAASPARAVKTAQPRPAVQQGAYKAQPPPPRFGQVRRHGEEMTISVTSPEEAPTAKNRRR